MDGTWKWWNEKLNNGGVNPGSHFAFETRVPLDRSVDTLHFSPAHCALNIRQIVSRRQSDPTTIRLRDLTPFQHPESTVNPSISRITGKQTRGGSMRSPSFLDLEIWLKPSESVPDRGREKERETESMYMYYANIRQFRGKYFIGKFTYILSNVLSIEI